MDSQQARELLKRYNDGIATDKEKDLVESWFLKLKGEQAPNDLPEDTLEEDTDEVWQTLQENFLPIKQRRVWPRIAAAASVVLCLSAGVYLSLHKNDEKRIAEIQLLDIAPGHNQATLTLANGQKIILTKDLHGQVARQGSTLIRVNNRHEIAYDAGSNVANRKIEFNTLSTAIGEQSPFPLVLPDGTKAWLNAESSISFPTVFAGKERLVRVSGEVYFEVVHNAAQPFKVAVAGQTIEDIGTSFNVNAYTDEPAVKTTLVEGSIKVTVGNRQLFVKPGQQLINANQQLTVIPVDVEEQTAWRNGNVEFDNADIQSVVRQLGRWYNVDFKYDGAVPVIHYSGLVPKKSNISEVLKMLKETGNTDFRIDGRTVTILNNNN